MLLTNITIHAWCSISMNNQELGIKNFRRRLAFGIRDTVLLQLNNPKCTSDMTQIPVSELGVISDISDDERQSLLLFVARAVDAGIHHFLYGLDNQPDGFVIKYNGDTLNKDGLYLLSNQDLPPISQESLFDDNGNKKPT